MATHAPARLFEVAPGAGGEPFEDARLSDHAQFQASAARSGADFKALGIEYLQQAGATVERLNFEIAGFPVDALVCGANQRRFLILGRGTPDAKHRSGLRRHDTVLKVGFVSMQLKRRQELPILIVTSDLPPRDLKNGHYLAALSPDVWDVVAWRHDLAGFHRLQAAFAGPTDAVPPDAPWRAAMERSTPTLLTHSAGPGAVLQADDTSSGGAP